MMGWKRTLAEPPGSLATTRHEPGSPKHLANDSLEEFVEEPETCSKGRVMPVAARRYALKPSALNPKPQTLDPRRVQIL